VAKITDLIAEALPPWSLDGEGYIFVYNFSKSYHPDKFFVPSYFHGIPSRKLGAVMLVNYHRSPVGPYGELLFIPALYTIKGKLYFTISKIYVDSQNSLVNGQKNWGIPKEYADFNWQMENNTTAKVMVKCGEKEIFKATINRYGISFPVSTTLMPFRFLQDFDGRQIITSPKGSGWAKLARPKIHAVNPDFFPDISQIKPLLSLSVQPFRLTFPPAEGLK
jgi:hypothetical protein